MEDDAVRPGTEWQHRSMHVTNPCSAHLRSPHRTSRPLRGCYTPISGRPKRCRAHRGAGTEWGPLHRVSQLL